jgi:hypothetical protein
MVAKVLQPIVYSLAGSGQLAKPVLVLTITDGEPTDTPRDMIVQVGQLAHQTVAGFLSGSKSIQPPTWLLLPPPCSSPAGDQGGSQQAGCPVRPQGSGFRVRTGAMPSVYRCHWQLSTCTAPRPKPNVDLSSKMALPLVKAPPQAEGFVIAQSAAADCSCNSCRCVFSIVNCVCCCCRLARTSARRRSWAS